MNMPFVRRAPAGSELPVLITPNVSGEGLLDAWHRLSRVIDVHLACVGGVLLRGFSLPSLEAFRAFAAAFGHPLLSYEFGSTPRSNVGGGIYTSTEYPAHQAIALHNEQAYTREWPMKIWFHCVTAAPDGGETPIADSRAIYRRMPDHILRRFEPGVRYVRNYGDVDVPWQQVFNTDSRAEVEAYCLRNGIEYKWTADGGLRTEQLCQAVARHPVTQEMVWFNQAHLFHASNLPPEVREALVALVGEAHLPRDARFADGSPIPDALLDEVRAVLDAESVFFPWEPGDVLMLDNMLVAHGRAPFKGPRKVVVAMAQPHGDLAQTV